VWSVLVIAPPRTWRGFDAAMQQLCCLVSFEIVTKACPEKVTSL